MKYSGILIKIFLIASYQLFFPIYSKTVFAQNGSVVINEVLNNPSGTENGAEWVELFNNSNEPISLKGCVLKLDDSAENQKVVFGDEDFIDKFKVISWDLSWLNNSGDQISLECANFSDIVGYGNASNSKVDSPDDGVSFGRNVDGTGDFYILSSVTMGLPNSNPPTNTPGPTNTSVPTIKPTVTNKPTPSTKPTSTSKPANTETPTFLLKNTDAPLLTQAKNLSTEEPVVDYIEDNNIVNDGNEESNKPTSQVLSEKTENRKTPIYAIVLVVIGILFIIASLYPILVKIKKRYNSKDES